MINTYFHQMQPFLKIMQVSFARELQRIEKLFFFLQLFEYNKDVLIHKACIDVTNEQLL